MKQRKMLGEKQRKSTEPLKNVINTVLELVHPSLGEGFGIVKSTLM